MADTPEIAITAPVAPAAPVVDAPVIAAEVAPAPVETAPLAADPAVEAPKAEGTVENPLGNTTEVKKTEEKLAEAAVEVKPATETPTEAKVELPVYEEFKLPENVKLEGELLGNFTKILGEIETGKLDHAGMQSKGQALIDLAAKNTIDSITKLNDSYVQIHQQAQKARFDALKADPELGGDKLPETISALKKSISEYGGTEQQIAEFRKEVTEAGLGASPAICRLLYNMQQKINKYTTEGTENRMVPGGRPVAEKVKDYQKFYQG